MERKLRISYSLLLLYEQGRIDDLVAYYFRLPIEKKPWESAGIDYHKGWEDYINEHKKLPPEFGGTPLKDPKCELKLEIDGKEFGPEYDWLELVCRIDCLDSPTLYEFKSGVTTIGKYEKAKQVGLYGVMAAKRGYEVDRLILHHFDGKADKSETSMIWFTPKKAEESWDYATTLGYEIYSFFNREGLWGLDTGKQRQS